MNEPEPGPSRTETVLLAGIYVVPLTLSIAFLAYVGLPGLALALLAVEAAVSAMVVAAKRPERVAAKRPERSRLGRLTVALAVLAVVAGLGAFVLLF